MSSDRHYDHDGDLLAMVAEFLHREVGQAEEEASVDSVSLMNLIRGWDEDMGTRDVLRALEAKTDWFWVFYDEERTQQPSYWHIAVYGPEGTVDIFNDDLNQAGEEALGACEQK